MIHVSKDICEVVLKYCMHDAFAFFRYYVNYIKQHKQLAKIISVNSYDFSFNIFSTSE